MWVGRKITEKKMDRLDRQIWFDIHSFYSHSRRLICFLSSLRLQNCRTSQESRAERFFTEDHNSKTFFFSISFHDFGTILKSSYFYSLNQGLREGFFCGHNNKSSSVIAHLSDVEKYDNFHLFLEPSTRLPDFGSSVRF